LKKNHGNLTLNNFVKAAIFVDMIVHIGTLDCIKSHALKTWREAEDIAVLRCSIPVLLHDTIGTRMNDKFLIYLNPKLGFKILYPFGWDVLVENPNRVIFHSFATVSEYPSERIIELDIDDERDSAHKCIRAGTTHLHDNDLADFLNKTENVKIISCLRLALGSGYVDYCAFGEEFILD
jgi:hypothetical protein